MSKRLIIRLGILGLAAIFLMNMPSFSKAAKGGKPSKPEEIYEVCLIDVYGADGEIALVLDPNSIPSPDGDWTHPFCIPDPCYAAEEWCNNSDFSARNPQIVMKFVTLDVSYFCNPLLDPPLRNEGCTCFNCSTCGDDTCTDAVIYEGVHYGGAPGGPSYGILVFYEEEGEVGAYYYMYGAYDSDGCAGGKTLKHGLYLSAEPDTNPWPPGEGTWTYTFTDWELFVGEAPGKDRKRACTGIGTFLDPVTITITVTDPAT